MNAQQPDLAHLRFISAGAGSGKTHRLTGELERSLAGGAVSPAGVVGTTFTVKAASQLRDRARERLIEGGRPLLAEQTSQALVGTVHSVCARILARFAFELGLSPELDVASAEDSKRLFNQALDEVLDPERVREMNRLAERLATIDHRRQRSWEDSVRNIAEEARSNDIDPPTLTEMGIESADRFLDYFPEPDCDDEATRALIEAAEEAIANIDLALDDTKGARDYVDLLQRAVAALKRDAWPWPRWISLSKKLPTKKSEAFALPVTAAASCYDRHAGFQRDIRSYIEGLFAIAGEAIARFQALKTERALVDYNDMEQLALRAFEDPVVAERLEEEVELLLVDEFQDTNPVQLALFMKLARFAREAVFVGDVKQAIYGFRGADPELVHCALDEMHARGCDVDVLGTSWRSRPALLRYLNTVFGDAFKGDGFNRANVELAPERDETHEAPAVVTWTVPGPRAGDPADALALGIADLVRSGHEVTDPDTGRTRPVRYGDIAALARTNAHVESIAKALRRRRVRMKMTLAGLLKTPEVCLARACLRRLSDPSDTLATAEIRALGSCEEPEVWLTDRLRSLAAEDDDHRWSEADHPIVSRIARLRGETVTESPAETVARALSYAGIRPMVAAWGPDAVAAAQRERNLDALVQLAVEYESHCASQHDAATLTGFLLWLEAPSSPELDRQPDVTGGDAVHVLTYHRAKGLEWPVVVATDFHDVWRPRIWDVRVLAEEDAFDLDNPLQGRRIRFYPEVFGGNKKGVTVLDALMDSEEGRVATAAREAECRRLAYVGMTRARDTIVVVVPARKPPAGAWVASFGSEHLLPAGDEHPLPEGEPIPSACLDLTAADLEPPAPPPFAPSWFAERAPIDSPLRERFAPSGEEPAAGAVAGEAIDVGPRFAVHGEDMGKIGTALHAVIAMEFVNPDRDDALDRAAALIRTGAGEQAVGPADAVECARRLRRALARMRHRLPISSRSSCE